ncbi:unnamed protein product [Adineta steineri]|uniref:Nuclear receptor domain-containing protein n=2 Tax=Adineta steineri TaxID=433720 RepID=A0A813S1I4_9BILA|nr:unnamed protein product [Adineta steineri]CAF3608584.1 unnamed protein product [Adineta steineri]
MNIEFRTKPGRKRKTKDGDICLVCGDPAIGLNFGVQTCSPCKAFFRRNAVKLGTIEFQCRGDGDCPVTSESRRQCNCCRLAKCIRIGMDRKAIRTDDQRLERLQLIETNRQKRAEQKVEDEKSLATNNKQIIIRPNGLLRYSKTYSFSLSSYDYTLLTNIFHEYERACVPHTYKEHLNMPVNETLTLHKFLNASSNMYIGFISYINSVPEFRSIPVDAKMLLIKNNVQQILRKNSTLIMKTITPDLDRDSPVFLHIFPKDVYMSMRDTSIALSPFVHDPMLMKLFLITLMLSKYLNVEYTNYHIECNDENITRNIFAAQNIYVELLWRYILSRCANYQQSVHFLTSLITRTLYSQTVQVKLNKFMNTIIPSQNHQLEPIIKSLWNPSEENSC